MKFFFSHTVEKNAKGKKGFTLLFAVLISSLLLSIGIAILSISLKQLLLSSSGRESQFAFFAADTGQECAKYWDRHGINGVSAFPTSTGAIATLGYQTISCNNQTIALGDDSVDSTSNAATSTFSISGFDPEPFCAIVTVAKNSDESTIVQSRGYNTCDPDDTHRTERAILSTF